MSHTLKGYVLEPVRISQGNSAFTMTPSNVIADPSAFAAYFPMGSEPNPRVDYMALVMGEGLLVNATFGWTKNEIVSRFDFDGSLQRFRPLPGGSPLPLGTVHAGLNTTRIKVPTPTQVNPPSASAPWRLSVGTGSGTTFNAILVTSFGSPPPGTVEIDSASGELNWNDTPVTGDLTVYAGQDIRFQRQAFFGFTESNGKIGMSSDAVLLLTPLPATIQYPLIRLGFGQWLIPDEYPDESTFGADPPLGHFKWAADTGRIKLTTADENLGKPVYYDGVLMQGRAPLPNQPVGTLGAPTSFPNQVIGGDLIFQTAGGYQIPNFSYLPDFDPPSGDIFDPDDVGSAGVVQLAVRGPNTYVKFSVADQAAYGAGTTVTLFFGDLPLERGISLRLFRTPVNLTGEGPTKDVTASYFTEGATFADPIIGAPEVFLPQTPRDDGTLQVNVVQGTGTFQPGPLPLLDGSVPLPVLAETYGYVLDYDKRRLKFAVRKNDLLLPLLQPAGAMVMSDPLIQRNGLDFAIETGPGTNVYTPLTIGTDVLFDGNATATFVVTVGARVKDPATGTFTGTTLTDPSVGAFASVLSGDELLASGQVFTVATVPNANTLTTDLPTPSPGSVAYDIHRGKEVLADRYFAEVELVDPATSVERVLPLGSAANSPRLQIPLQWAGPVGPNGNVRIRFGATTWSSSVTTVANDGAFTSLSQGQVEVSATTGNLNFSTSDIGTSVFWARKLKIKRDYTISPQLGFINFTERFLAYEEAVVNYYTVDSDTGLPVQVKNEPAAFIVRKELCSHTSSSVLSFNPTGRTVAVAPAPQVWRGGRPQDPTQIHIDTTASTVTFLPDTVLTDALPHGANVGPSENVYIDYYITQARGGEQSITVQLPPMSIAQVSITDDPTLNPTLGVPFNRYFVVQGDRTANFPPGYLLRVENVEVHYIASSTFDGTQTTVTLVAGDSFGDSYQNPKLYVSSGLTRLTSLLFFPAYFVFELVSYALTPRGSNKLTIIGDRMSAYKQGTVIRFTDGSGSFQHFYPITGVALDSNGNTTLTLLNNTKQQYTPGTHILSYTVRPILDEGQTSITTSRVPVLTQPYTVFRRVEGQIGRVLTEPTDFTIDASGVVQYKTPLAPNEEISIFYTGHTIYPAGLRFKTSYTALTVPTTQNGLPNQVLQADYTVDAPDSFYFRVETLTNFQAELAKQYEDAAKASIPSGGPILSNAASGGLPTKGRPSLYFDEGHLANEDYVARMSLLWYNETVNTLEDVLEDMDGRIVGHRSGRFLFDASVGNVHPPGAVTNQIDDIIKVSDAPYEIVPLFSVVSIGTYQPMYLPADTSRFYPTAMATFGVTAPGTETGDEVYDTKHKSLTAVAGVQTRLAFAMITEDAASGAGTLVVDNAQGSASVVRPPFKSGMKCVVQKQDGTFINAVGTPITVSAIPDQTHLTISGLAGDTPAGSTVYRSPEDDSAQTGVDVLTVYQYERDYAFNPDSGQILYVKPFPPYDGSVPLVPVPLQAVPLPAGQPINVVVAFNNQDTAPTKFPALYGKTLDDNGDMSFPLISPRFDCERTTVGEPTPVVKGLLEGESTDLSVIPTVTTMPFLGTGDITGLDTITLTAGTFPAPAPKIYDLVRVTSGLNGGTPYRRILTVTPNSIQVDTSWATNDTNVTFEIGVSSTTLTGSGTFTTSILTDLLANFSSVKVGWTVVVTSGTYQGYRLQVVSVDSATQITFSSGLPAGGSYTYRIDNPLPTFGGPGSLLDSLGQNVSGALDIYLTRTAPKAEIPALEDFLDQLFTDVLTGTTGQASGATFTDLSADFEGPDSPPPIVEKRFLYIRSGPAQGVYSITTPITTTTLTVSPAFPASDSGISYRVVSIFGASVRGAQDAFKVLQETEAYVASTQAFNALVTTPFPVVKPGPVPDTVAFARGFLGSEFAARSTMVATRQTNVQSYIGSLSNVLGGSDRLYDRRYTWIDARINRKTGIIVKQARAVISRIETQIDITNQLVKLLSVQGS